MPANRRLSTCLFHGAAWLASALLLAATIAPSATIEAQSQFLGPVCAAPPTPADNDGWPKAKADFLGTTVGPFTFAAASLLSNDTAASALTVTGVSAVSSRGGTIAETAPGMFTYTPAPLFSGDDVFTYFIRDTMLQAETGIVHITVSADVAAPAVNITSPIGGATVSGAVAINAAASDDVGVAGVKFFDGAAQIGPEIVGPTFTTSWDTTLVSDGLHTLTAVARDAAGNATTSAGVVVTVSNRTAVPNVVGATDTDARAAIAAASLVVGGVTSANSASVPAGQVISQSPAAGASVLRGSAVSYVLSLGPVVTIAVPDVVGQTQTDATTAITGAGLAVGTVSSASSSTVAAGSVISTNPAAGTLVSPGSAVALVVSTGPAAAPDGLVLALGFDEASGTVAIDSSASAKNGTIKQAVRAAGKFGGALKFDGVDDWVTVTDTTASPLDLTTGMTLEAWVNPAALSGWETVLYKERGLAGEGLLCYALYAHDGAPLALGRAVPAGYVRLNNATQTTDKAVRGTAKLALNTWTHIATTYDGAVQKFYVNGVLVGSANPIVAPSLNTIVQSNGALRIGGNASSTGEFFQGLIDEVRVYKRALSAAEITRDMNTPVQ